MEYLLVVARSRDLCRWCNENMQGLSLKGNYDALLHLTIEIGKKNVNKLGDILFEPYIYMANYKHSYDDTDPIIVTMRWIYHGFPNKLFWNRFCLTLDSAKIVHKIFNRDVWIIGNAVETPEQLKMYKVPDDAFVVRFNKAIVHESRIDLCIFNDVLFEKLKNEIQSSSVPCVVVQKLNPDFDALRRNDELFTTGIMTMMWITKFFTMYKTLTVVGFNMVNPGEKAHYFDSETPAKPCPGFAGHDAAHEKQMLRDYADCPYLNMRLIQAMGV